MKPSASFKKIYQKRSRFDSLTYFISVCLAIIVIVGADVCFDVFHKNEDSKKVTQDTKVRSSDPSTLHVAHAFATRKGDRFELTRVRPQQSGWQGTCSEMGFIGGSSSRSESQLGQLAARNAKS